MENDKSKGTFAKWFGIKKSGCCDVKIEEIRDEDESDGGKQRDEKVPHGDNDEKK